MVYLKLETLIKEVKLYESFLSEEQKIKYMDYQARTFIASWKQGIDDEYGLEYQNLMYLKNLMRTK